MLHNPQESQSSMLAYEETDGYSLSNAVIKIWFSSLASKHAAHTFYIFKNYFPFFYRQ